MKKAYQFESEKNKLSYDMEIEKQGFPFWCGKIVVEKKIDIDDVQSVLKFNLKGINVIKIEINGITKTYLNSSTVDLSRRNYSCNT